MRAQVKGLAQGSLRVKGWATGFGLQISDAGLRLRDSSFMFRLKDLTFA